MSHQIFRNTFAIASVIMLVGCTNRTGENLSAANDWTTQERVGKLTVGLQVIPAVPRNNSFFITLQNKKGEPINDAKVEITSLKQFLFSTDRKLPSTCVAPGTYKIDTNMAEGLSEVNISITPPKQRTTNIRIEADIRKDTPPNHAYLFNPSQHNRPTE